MSKKPLAIVILAAGKGTRMKSESPKVMHALAGRPMIGWLLETVAQLSPQKIVVVVGPGMPELVAAAAPHACVVQKERNGTGGAVKIALPALKNFSGDVLVLLGDTPLISVKTLKSLIAARGNDGIAVLGMNLADPTGYGRLIADNDGTLQKIVEEKDGSAREKSVTLVSTGAFCIDGAKIDGWVKKIGSNNAAGEFYLTDLPEIAAASGAKTKICITNDTDEVRGCNSRIDLAALENTVQNRMREAALLSGVSMIDPTTVYFHYDTKLGRDILIEPGVFFGPGVEISDGVHLKAYSHLEGAKIGRDSSVGPFARLRPGTDIGAEVRIGNFVEIKKSKIGKRSKISHLGYVGDTVMGDDVNFGCGAITVNYDGFNKHETIIGKGVMIGSNSNLVAPVHVGDGAFIAAGTTITENVPANALAISRNAAQIRAGWAAEFRKRKGAAAKILAQKTRKKK